MMGPDEINPGADSVPSPGRKRRRDSTVAVRDVASRVLDDNDLLGEILLRVGFPTNLVHAGAVCRRWFRQASDPAFLHRFRNLHPPRLLGFYFNNWLEHKPHFVPVPTRQPPELSAVIHRASFDLNTYNYNSGGFWIVDCWGGNVFVSLDNYHAGFGYPFAVHRPLCSQSGMTIFPPLPCPQIQHDDISSDCKLVFKEERDSFFYFWMESTHEKATVHVYMLQDGMWCMHTSATTEVHGIPPNTKLVLVDNKVYMCSGSYVLVFDLKTVSSSKIQHPVGVGFHEIIMLLLADDGDDDDSGVYLIRAKALQLDIWLHKGDNWLLVDTIYLHEMHAGSSMLDHILAVVHNTVVRISEVGANAEFVFLQMGQLILYLDIKCRTLHKAYEMMMTDKDFGHYIHPFPHSLRSRMNL